MFGSDSDFWRVKNKVFFSEGFGGGTVVEARKPVEFSSNPLKRQEQIRQVAKEIKQEKELSKQTPNAQFEFDGKQYNNRVYGEDGTPLPASEVSNNLIPTALLSVIPGANPRTSQNVQIEIGGKQMLAPIVVNPNGGFDVDARSAVPVEAKISNSDEPVQILTSEQFQQLQDQEEGLNNQPNQIKSISQAESIPELSELAQNALNKLDSELKLVTNKLESEALSNVLLQQPELSQLQPQIAEMVHETAQKQRVENGKKGLFNLKNLASGFKNKAKDIWKALDKDLTPKQVLGLVLLAGGMTVATLAALPVGAALLGGTIAGTAASYGAIGLAGGVAGNLALAPFAAGTASLVSAGIASQGINMLRNRPKETLNKTTTVVESGANTPQVTPENITQSVFQETVITANTDLPLGFEGSESKEILKEVNLETLGVGSQLEITILDSQNQPATTRVEVTILSNGEKGIKFLTNQNPIAKVTAIDEKGLHPNKIIAGADLNLTYLGNNLQRQIKVENVQITKEVVTTGAIVNPESGNEKIANLENVSLEYEKALEGNVSKLDTINKSIKLLEDNNLDSSGFHAQKSELLKGSLEEENKVVAELIKLVPDIKKSQNIPEQNRTPEQQKLVERAEKLNQLGFSWVGGDAEGQAVLVTGPSEYGKTIAENKTEKVETKPVVETSVENTNETIEQSKTQTAKLIENLGEVEKVIDTSLDSHYQDIDALRGAFDEAGISDNDLKTILGLPAEISNTKLEKVLATAVFLGDIQKGLIANNNLGFLVNSEIPVGNAIAANPALEKLANIKPSFGSTELVSGIKKDITTLVENAALAKEIFDLGATRDKIKNIKQDPKSILFEDNKLAFSADLMLKVKDGDPKSEVIVDKIKEARPELAEILTPDNMQALYDNKSNLSATERKSLLGVADLVEELLTTGKIEKKTETVNPEIAEKIQDSGNLQGDIIQIDTGNGTREVKFGNLNQEDATITVSSNGSIERIPISDIKSFINNTLDQRKKEEEEKKKTEQESEINQAA
jgi:hypothetical protein